MGGSTIAILGCGNMGTAIMSGILSAIGRKDNSHLPEHLQPSRIIGCVRSAESAARLSHHFGTYLRHQCKIDSSSASRDTPRCQIDIWNDNTAAVRHADVVLLACQPSQMKEILGETSIRQHLTGKLLLSICVGIPPAKIYSAIYGDTQDGAAATTSQLPREDERCYVVHAMPNIASTVGESATVLSTTDEVAQNGDTSAISRLLPNELQDLADWIFTTIGTVTHVSPSLMNAASVTGASTVAFFAIALEGVVRGAVEMGLEESDALQLAAQAMKGTAELVLKGMQTTSPLQIRDAVMTPNGCTACGVETLQKANVQEAFAEATCNAVERVIELGRET